jgi:hypothetical protein
MIRFISASVTHSLFITVKYSAIVDFHDLQFTVARTLGFFVSTSRLLAMDLNIETITSNHYEVFLSATNFPWLSSTKNSELCHLTLKTVQSQSHIAPDGQWVRLGVVYYCLTVTVLFLWGALSDERSSLSFVRL